MRLFMIARVTSGLVIRVARYSPVTFVGSVPLMAQLVVARRTVPIWGIEARVTRKTRKMMIIIRVAREGVLSRGLHRPPLLSIA
jgi:hypothetical protein